MISLCLLPNVLAKPTRYSVRSKKRQAAADCNPPPPLYAHPRAGEGRGGDESVIHATKRVMCDEIPRLRNWLPNDLLQECLRLKLVSPTHQQHIRYLVISLFPPHFEFRDQLPHALWWVLGQLMLPVPRQAKHTCHDWLSMLLRNSFQKTNGKSFTQK